MTNRMTKRNFLAAGAGVLAMPLIARFAHAAEFTFKYGGDRPATHPVEIEAARVAARIKEETAGRVEIQLFPNNQLGGDADMLNQLRAGAIHFFNVSGMLVSPLVPVSAIHGLGFIFKDYDAVWTAMDGDLGKLVKSAINAAGLHVQDKMWDSGFRQITTSTKPIKTAADLDGFKIRVPVAPMWVSLFTSLGANPTSIHAAELYSSLQTRIVDGQENALPTIESFKMYEVQKYCSLTNHMWDGLWILTNKRTWDKLPPDLQEIISRNWSLGADAERKTVAAAAASLRVSLESKGMEFNDAALDTFRTKLAGSGFYSDWKAKFGEQAWAILEQYTGKLV